MSLKKTIGGKQLDLMIYRMNKMATLCTLQLFTEQYMLGIYTILYSSSSFILIIA